MPQSLDTHFCMSVRPSPFTCTLRRSNNVNITDLQSQGKIITWTDRWWHGRPMWARMGKRTLVIVDTPCVHQLLETFVSKLYAQSYSFCSIDVSSRLLTSLGLHSLTSYSQSLLPSVPFCSLLFLTFLSPSLLSSPLPYSSHRCTVRAAWTISCTASPTAWCAACS